MPAILQALGILITIAVLGAIGVSQSRALTPDEQVLLNGLDLALLVYFLAAAVLPQVVATRHLAALGQRWFDVLALAALLHATTGEHATWAWFLARQTLALAAVFVRAHVTQRFLNRLWLRPARLMVGSFAGAVAVGALLLTLPISSTSGKSVGGIDAVFTATSAVCVTGLVVKDTGADYTLFGQLVILGLIQLGGLGIMTFSVAMVLMLGRSLSKSREVSMGDMLDQESAHEVVHLIQFVVLSTLIIECAGAIGLFLCFGQRQGYNAWSVYSAVFHAISAFCNAGFSLFTSKSAALGGFNNLEGYRGYVAVNLIITSLIILGGLGFPVMRDLMVLGRKSRLGEGRPARLRTHTKVVLSTTLVLIVLGAALFYALEVHCTLRGLPATDRVLASYFQSVTARTAGFNTVDFARVGTPALVVIMALMFIGASPCSTGGGIKTTTAAILFQAMRSAFRRRSEVEFFGRTVPRQIIRRSIALVTLTVLVLTAATVALASVEDKPLEKLLFEEISAFGTVGLSTGITPDLTAPGKLIITFLMFIGRVGPLTLMFSLVGEARPARYKFPETHLMVG